MKKNLTEGGILQNIANFALPYMLAYFLQILYGLADLFIIGQFGAVKDTTAVSNAAQVMYLITVVIIGLAMGSTVLIGRAVGANDSKRIAHVMGNALTFFFCLSIVLVFVLLCSRQAIIDLINTPVEAVSGTRDYLTVTFIGIPFIVAYNVIASFFRGLGDSRSPMYFVAIACLVNIVLDYLFIGALGLGPMGAALGTTLSQMTSVLIAVLVFFRNRKQLDISASDFRVDHSTLMNILKIGLPIGLQDGLIQVGFIAITVIANMRGLDDAAAVGIVEKFIGLLFIIPSAMLSTVSVISSQNIGAGKRERAVKTLRYAIAITFSFGMVWSILLQFYPAVPVSFFTSDSHVILLGSEYLKSYVWDCALAGIHFCFSGYFTACGLSILSFAHNMLSLVLVRLPFSYLLSVHYPDTLYPMGWASPMGSMLSIVICVIAYRILAKREG